MWNGTKWLVNDNSNVLSGTFSGACTFTGLVTANTGIKVSSAAGQSTLINYIESAEGDLGTITTWSPTSKKYKWIRVGNKVTLWYRIEDTTGATFTSVHFVFPADCPAPSYFSTWADNEIFGSGYGLSATTVDAGTQVNTVVMYAISSVNYIYVFQASAATKLMTGVVEYFTA